VSELKHKKENIQRHASPTLYPKKEKQMTRKRLVAMICQTVYLSIDTQEEQKKVRCVRDMERDTLIRLMEEKG